MDYWREIHIAVHDIFKCVIFNIKIKTLYFGYIFWEWLKSDKYLLNILLVAVKKTLTRIWLSQESPTLNTWMDITMDIYRMERITAFVNHKLEKFALYWGKWVYYVISHRSDFIFS